jgi:flagellar biogenesis protein FliO
VRAAATRRANRRIIMRQVGDRLIPVGVTSGRVHALPAELGGSVEASEGNNGNSRRSRRRQHQELNHLLGSMGLGGQDLEEVLLILSMIF